MILRNRVNHRVGLWDFSKYHAMKIYTSLPDLVLPERKLSREFVLVIGCGHSGTTLMAARLGNHPNIFGIGRETNIFNNPLYSLRCLLAIVSEWSYLCESLGHKVVLEKTPKHIHAYDRAQKVLTNSKFIVMVRNPLDNISSLYKRFHDLSFCVDRWIMDNSEAIKVIGNKNVYSVKYEDLTRQPEIIFKQVLEFIGLDYNDSVLCSGESMYGKIGQEGNMAIRERQVSEPIRVNEGGWKDVFTTEQVDYVLSRTETLATQLGYELV